MSPSRRTTAPGRLRYLLAMTHTEAGRSTVARGAALARTAVLTVVVVALAACSGGASPEGEDVDLSPFTTLMNAELGESQETISQLREHRSQERLAQCVRAAGFEYHPDASDVTAVDVDLDDYEERLRTQGWGYFTQPEVPEDYEIPEPTEQMKYEQSLSPSAHEEYLRVLFGETDPATGQRVEGTGCFDHAYGEDADDDSPEVRFAELLEEVRTAWEVAEEEPEVREARDLYRECLSRAGFPGVDIDAAELLDERLVEEFPDGSFASNDPRLAELASWELELADAHLDCLEESDVQTVAARATARVETQVLERRADEVEAYLAAMREYYELD